MGTVALPGCWHIRFTFTPTQVPGECDGDDRDGESWSLPPGGKTMHRKKLRTRPYISVLTCIDEM